jgi:hypothetical protein
MADLGPLLPVKTGVAPAVRIEREPMKKLIPFVLGVWVLAMVGCTATTTTTTSTTTERQKTPSARVDPTIDNTRSTNNMNLGPR